MPDDDKLTLQNYPCLIDLLWRMQGDGINVHKADEKYKPILRTLDNLAFMLRTQYSTFKLIRSVADLCAFTIFYPKALPLAIFNILTYHQNAYNSDELFVLDYMLFVLLKRNVQKFVMTSVDNQEYEFNQVICRLDTSNIDFSKYVFELIPNHVSKYMQNCCTLTDAYIAMMDTYTTTQSVERPDDLLDKEIANVYYCESNKLSEPSISRNEISEDAADGRYSGISSETSNSYLNKLQGMEPLALRVYTLIKNQPTFSKENQIQMIMAKQIDELVDILKHLKGL